MSEVLTPAPAPATRRRAGRQATAPIEATAPLEAPVTVEVPPQLTPEQRVEQQLADMLSTRSLTSTVEMQEVKLYPHHVELNVNGIDKAISLMDFKQLIDAQLQIESKLECMALPFNTYVFAKSASMIQLACYYPERKIDVKHQASRDYGVKEYKGVLMPNIIISHTLKLDGSNWLVTDSRYFATNKQVKQLPDNKIIESKVDQEGLWRVPTPNFYDDGRMCYGQNTMPVKYSHNLRGLDYYYAILSESPFNNDLGLNAAGFEGNPGKWFTHLQTVEKFPYELLTARTGY